MDNVKARHIEICMHFYKKQIGDSLVIITIMMGLITGAIVVMQVFFPGQAIKTLWFLAVMLALVVIALIVVITGLKQSFPRLEELLKRSDNNDPGSG